jgi:hypothetical protein
MAELTSVSDIKTYAGITGSTDDALLATLLESAEDALRRYCNRLDGWDQAEHTEILDGHGTPEFVVTNVPVATSPAPVVSIDYGGSTNETISASLYTFDTDEVGRFTWRGGSSVAWEYGDDGCPNVWPEGNNKITVVYTGGYATIPASLAQAAIDATLWLYFQRRGDKTMVSETLGAYTYTRWQPVEGHELPPQVELLANPFRRGSGVAV